MYIDVEGIFRPQRLLQIVDSYYQEHWSIWTWLETISALKLLMWNLCWLIWFMYETPYVYKTTSCPHYLLRQNWMKMGRLTHMSWRTRLHVWKKRLKD
ncbi:hypothetical protein ACS0TY_004867 [Phlomoides rotata]